MKTFAVLILVAACGTTQAQSLVPAPASPTTGTPASQPAPAGTLPPETKPAATEAKPASTETKPAAAEPKPAVKDAPAPGTSAGVDAKGQPKWIIGPEPTIEKKDDGSMIVDGRFAVRGEGTADKPYEVPWEMLVSAQEAFAPDKKLRTIPGRVQMLDGKVVKLSGNILFPLFVKQPKELLAMMNQWDGCCIGVPPTPYDAIEVKLAKGIIEEERYATQGQIIGTFGVKPFLTGDWLVGLYIMDKAQFSIGAMGPANAPHQGLQPQ
jgi:hypothetical protein